MQAQRVKATVKVDESDDESDDSFDMDEAVDEEPDYPMIVVIEMTCHQFVHGFFFQGFILFTIGMAAVVQGFQTSDTLASSSIVQMLDTVITWIFLSEVVLKLIGTLRKPYRYFFMEGCTLDMWNVFDCIVVILSMMDISAVAVLRLVRLLRVLKVVRSLPTLQMLIFGVISSMSAIVYIFVLLVVVFFFFGVIGMVLFDKVDSNGEQDELFGDMVNALIALFGISTGASWSTIMYSRIFRCNEGTPEETIWPFCTTLSTMVYVGSLYFIIFYLISNLTMMNLVIGVMTNEMNHSRKMQKLDREGLSEDHTKVAETVKAQRRALRAEKLRKSKFPLKYLVQFHLVPRFDGGLARFTSNQRDMLRSIDESESKCLLFRDAVTRMRRRPAEMPLVPDFTLRTMLGPARPPAPKLTDEEKEKLKKKKQKPPPRDPAPPRPQHEMPYHKRCPLRQGQLGPNDEMPVICQKHILFANFWAWYSNTGVFVIAGLVLVVMAVIIIAVESFEGGAELQWVIIGNELVKWGFFAELLCKVVAAGPRPWLFLFESDDPVFKMDFWALMDTVVVVGSFFSVDGIAVLRLFRLVRILKLVRSLPALRDLIAQLVSAINSLIWIFALLALALYVFAVGGVFIFRDNDHVHFGNLYLSLLTMFQVATGDSWDRVWRLQVKGCNYTEGTVLSRDFPTYPDCTADASPVMAPIFFILYMMTVYMVVFQLVLGIIIVITKGNDEDQKKEDRIEQVLVTNKLPVELDNSGKAVIFTTTQKLKRMAKDVEKLQRTQIWQLYRFSVAHMMPLFSSKSILRPPAPEQMKPIAAFQKKQTQAATPAEKAFVASLLTGGRGLFLPYVPDSAIPEEIKKQQRRRDRERAERLAKTQFLKGIVVNAAEPQSVVGLKSPKDGEDARGSWTNVLLPNGKGKDVIADARPGPAVPPLNLDKIKPLNADPAIANGTSTGAIAEVSVGFGGDAKEKAKLGDAMVSERSRTLAKSNAEAGKELSSIVADEAVWLEDGGNGSDREQ